jgi:hypothetical protein
VADNVRLGKEEEEVLCRKGDGDDDNGYRGWGGNGEVDMEGKVCVEWSSSL